MALGRSGALSSLSVGSHFSKTSHELSRADEILAHDGFVVDGFMADGIKFYEHTYKQGPRSVWFIELAYK